MKLPISQIDLYDISCHIHVMAAVILDPRAILDFDQLPTRIKARMQLIFVRLENWPEVSGAKPLRGDLAGRFRMRTGDYRVQFLITGEDVVIERIGHRDGFYEG